MKYTVVGARGKVGHVEDFVRRLQQESERLGLKAQAFDADMIFGEDHLLSAAEHAERSFARGSNVASDLMVEVLVYAAGERQISKALQKVGVKDDQERIVLLMDAEERVGDFLKSLDLSRDDGLIPGKLESLLEFGISEDEIQTVPPERVLDLVLEQVAFVELLK